MAVDKLVDSTQLDADLTSVANAIRTKGGTSASLAFPADFVQAIADIPSGGGFSIDEINNAVRSGADATVRDDFVSGSVTITGTKIFPFLFAGAKNLTEIHGPNVTALFFVNAGGGNISQSHFIDCSSLAVVDLPNLNEVGPSMFQRCNSLEHIYLPSVTKGGMDSFSNSSELLTIVLPAYNNKMDRVARSCAKLTGVDLGSPSSIWANTFNDDTVLTTLIIRGTASAASLSNINAFANTPFASGGTGGTLYVPSALISSYQADTNWSTILGYANNQIKSIESTHTDPNAPIDLTLYYADGTLIPT